MYEDLIKQVVAKVISILGCGTFAPVHPKPFPIGVSNRHIHLSQQDLELLFGAGYSLNCRRDLSQPGQCAAAETVIIAGPKGTLEQVRVLGPVRSQTQVEISRSDCFKLGVDAPTRESGKLGGSGSIAVIGPKGSIQLAEGLIVAKRHMHMSPFDAQQYGVSDGRNVQVKVAGERGIIFDNVVVRVSDKFILEFHVDTDEANCAGIMQGDQGYLISGAAFSEIPEPAPAPIQEPVRPVARAKEIEEPVALVTEETVRRVWKKKAALAINKGVVCTPLAKDVIRELGVEVIWR